MDAFSRARTGTTLLYCTNLPAVFVLTALASPWHDALLTMAPSEARVHLSNMVSVWVKVAGFEITAQQFCAFLAVCKLAGSLAFTGIFGKTLDRLAIPCWLIFFLGAAYTLVQTGRHLFPVVPFFIALLVRVVCELCEKEPKTKNS